MKKCPKCGKDKELSLFYNSKGRIGNKSYLCIDCHSIVRSEHDHTINGRYVSYKAGAKRRGFTFTLTMDDFIGFWNKNCFYCGDLIEGVGLDRVNTSIGYEIKNVVSCCRKCNHMKSTSTYLFFINQCRKIVERHDIGE